MLCKITYDYKAYEAFEIFIKRNSDTHKYMDYKLIHKNIDKDSSSNFNPNKNYLYHLNGIDNKEVSNEYSYYLKHLYNTFKNIFNSESDYVNCYNKLYDINKNNNFNSTNDYPICLNFLISIEKNSQPLYFLSLIPDTGNTIKYTIYLLHFTNWAIYYYNYISEIYENIPKDPSKADKLEVENNVKLIANITENLGISTSKDKLNKSTSNIFKKNKFALKPTDFLIICSLFARGWYDEHFFNAKNSSGCVEFSYYFEEYIKNSANVSQEFYCKEYNNNSRYESKKINKLFKSGNIDIQLANFSIKAEKTSNNNSKNKNYSYSVSIQQYGCKHSFYYFARLHQYRYSKNFKRVSNFKVGKMNCIIPKYNFTPFKIF